MYRKLYKKLFSLFICLAILSSCIIPAALAYQSSNGVAQINNSDEGTIYVGGQKYPYTYTVEGTISTGGRSVFYSSGRFIRQHKTVSVTFYTQSTGLKTCSGGATTYNGVFHDEYDRLAGAVGTTYSYYVKYSGQDTPVGIQDISAAIKVIFVTGPLTEESFDFTL